MKKKIFYLNLFPSLIAARQALRSVVNNDVEWYDGANTHTAGELYDLNQNLNYSNYLTFREFTKPNFDYYLKHQTFDIDEIEKIYYDELCITVDRNRFNSLIDCLNTNIKLIKEIQPDIILIRFYSGFEFALLYLLYQIKHVRAFKSIGGANENSDISYYIDIFLEQELINNFHNGYGESHIKSMVYGSLNNIPEKTFDYIYKLDTATEPENDTHWIVTCPKICPGTCAFCPHSRLSSPPAFKSDVEFTSDEYIEFITDRLQYFQNCGVTKIFVPGVATFYNKIQLKKFHEAYIRKNLKLKFIDSYFKFEDITEETIPLLKEINFHSMKLGLESFNPEVRAKVGKSFSNKTVYDVTNLLKKHNILFKYSLIWNLPFTNHFDLINELKFLNKFKTKYNLNVIGWNRFKIYDGTDICLNPTKYNLKKYHTSQGYEYFKRDGIEFCNITFHSIANEIKRLMFYNDRTFKQKYLEN